MRKKIWFGELGSSPDFTGQVVVGITLYACIVKVPYSTLG
jgi:hypothetical protein